MAEQEQGLEQGLQTSNAMLLQMSNAMLTSMCLCVCVGNCTRQITYDYRGRLHAIYCEKSIPTFKPMGPLAAPALAALQKL